MVIQKLDLTDGETAEELWSLQHAAYRVEASLIGVSDLPPLRESVADLQACGELFWGCRTEDGEIAAAVSVERGDEPGIMTICRVMVHPDYFRRGLASLLLSAVMEAHGPKTGWEVTAEARNQPAVSLYGKLGFKPEGTFSPAPGITMLRMRKPAGSEAET